MPRLPISRLFCWHRPNLHRNPRGKNRGRLPGIGQAKAEAILADRAANGPYAAPEDLTRVKGISQRMVQQWGSDITVGG
jgi:competence ComEA-like helix-hairpin-helix protein